MRRITQQRNINLAQAPKLPRHILPVPQAVLGIDRHEDDAASAVFELVEAVLEREDLGRAHEGEGRRDEEDDEPGFGGVGV